MLPEPSKSHISSWLRDAAFMLQKYPWPGTQASVSTGHCPAPLEITTRSELLYRTLSLPTGSISRALPRNLFPALLKNLVPAVKAEHRQICGARNMWAISLAWYWNQPECSLSSIQQLQRNWKFLFSMLFIIPAPHITCTSCKLCLPAKLHGNVTSSRHTVKKTPSAPLDTPVPLALLILFLFLSWDMTDNKHFLDLC